VGLGTFGLFTRPSLHQQTPAALPAAHLHTDILFDLFLCCARLGWYRRLCPASSIPSLLIYAAFFCLTLFSETPSHTWLSTGMRHLDTIVPMILHLKSNHSRIGSRHTVVMILMPGSTTTPPSTSRTKIGRFPTTFTVLTCTTQLCKSGPSLVHRYANASLHVHWNYFLTIAG
jgi:hypothetical protein